MKGIQRAARIAERHAADAEREQAEGRKLVERAGFARVGTIRRSGRAGQFGPLGGVASETRLKSRFSDPVYYVFDNRGRAAPDSLT